MHENWHNPNSSTNLNQNWLDPFSDVPGLDADPNPMEPPDWSENSALPGAETALGTESLLSSSSFDESLLNEPRFNAIRFRLDSEQSTVSIPGSSDHPNDSDALDPPVSAPNPDEGTSWQYDVGLFPDGNTSDNSVQSETGTSSELIGYDPLNAWSPSSDNGDNTMLGQPQANVSDEQSSADSDNSVDINGVNCLQGTSWDQSIIEGHDPQVIHFASSQHPYTTISDSGAVYKHTSDYSGDSYYAGYVRDRSIYNPSGHYQGSAGTDGNVYDHNGHFVGWADCHGDVYNSAGHKIYHTTKGVVGGAAYLLLVYHGGVS